MQILLAVATALYRSSLRRVIEGQFGDAAIHEIGAAGALGSVAGEASTLDLAIVELGLPGLGGVSGIRSLCRRLDGIPIIAIADQARHMDLLPAIQAGANGCVPVSSECDVLLDAIRQVIGGNVYVHPEAIAASAAAGSEGDRAPRSDGPVASVEDARLTRRQIEVLDLLAEGHPNREISSRLGVAEGTIRVHVAAILRALNVRNRTQAALFALERRGAGLDRIAS